LPLATGTTAPPHGRSPESPRDTLRAPIFEDKVIDFIVELAKIGERKITPEELLAMPESAGEDAVPG
jgi:trigger factor